MPVDRDDATPDSGQVRVAGFGRVGAGGRPDTAIARLDGAASAGTASPAADLAALGENAELGESAGVVPIALFDAEHVADARGDAPVADLGGPAAAHQSTGTPDRTADEPGVGQDVRRSRKERRGRTAGSSRNAGSARPTSGTADLRTTRVGTAGTGTAEAELGPDADPETVARSICLRLLTDRARTRQDLAQALRRKGVPDESANAVLERFSEVDLIDDAALAGQWVRTRHTVRGLGRHALAVELRRKGVADDVAGEALAEIDTDAEVRRAHQLVDRKLRGMAIGTVQERAVAGRRLAGMLARKGYGASVAYRVVREALADHGADAEELGDTDPPDG